MGGTHSTAAGLDCNNLADIGPAYISQAYINPQLFTEHRPQSWHKLGSLVWNSVFGVSMVSP